jgi:hypothetical protein
MADFVSASASSRMSDVNDSTSHPNDAQTFSASHATLGSASSSPIVLHRAASSRG